MGTFSWLGGDIGNPFHWVSGGSAGYRAGPDGRRRDVDWRAGRWRGERRPSRTHGRFRLFRRHSAGRRRNPVRQHRSEGRHQCDCQLRTLIGFERRKLHTLGRYAERSAGSRIPVRDLQAIQRHEYSRRYCHCRYLYVCRRHAVGCQRGRRSRTRRRVWQQRWFYPERRHAHGRASTGDRGSG